MSRRSGADPVSGPAPAVAVAPDLFNYEWRSIYPKSINRGCTRAKGEDELRLRLLLFLFKFVYDESIDLIYKLILI